MLPKILLSFIILVLCWSLSFSQYDTGCKNKPTSEYPRLGKYNVDPASTTVSGISNGGAYAAQISFIYSSFIHGAGIFAASPYPMAYFLGNNRDASAIFSLDKYYPLIDSWAAEGSIDSTDNLKDFKAYVYMGFLDILIHPTIVRNVIKQFRHYGASVKDNMGYIVSGHCMPSIKRKDRELRMGWLQNICDAGFQGVFDMFSHFLGSDYVAPKDTFAEPTGKLFRTDLSEFFPGCIPGLYSILPTGLTYVPKICADGKVQCRLHIAFHGWGLPYRAAFVGSGRNAFVEETGYLQAADANNVILLFPESAWRGWDIIGFTSRTKWVHKDGVQNVGIKKMIRRIIYGE